MRHLVAARVPSAAAFWPLPRWLGLGRAVANAVNREKNARIALGDSAKALVNPA